MSTKITWIDTNLVTNVYIKVINFKNPCKPLGSIRELVLLEKS